MTTEKEKKYEKLLRFNTRCFTLSVTFAFIRRYSFQIYLNVMKIEIDSVQASDHAESYCVFTVEFGTLVKNLSKLCDNFVNRS